MNTILHLNAYIKFVEFVLNDFDNAHEDKTIGQVRNEFKKTFKTIHPLLNQYFGIYRLIPLIQIKEEYKSQKKELSVDIVKIKIIRDAIAHSNFSIDQEGYIFNNDEGKVRLSFSEFTEFIHRIENIYHEENKVTE